MLDIKGQPLTPVIMRRVHKAWSGAVPEPYVPTCFPTRRWFLIWLELWTQRDDQASGFCVDCTPIYKARMVKQGKCEFPKVTFDTDSDGFTRGTR